MRRPIYIRRHYLLVFEQKQTEIISRRRTQAHSTCFKSDQECWSLTTKYCSWYGRGEGRGVWEVTWIIDTSSDCKCLPSLMNMWNLRLTSTLGTRTPKLTRYNIILNINISKELCIIITQQGTQICITYLYKLLWNPLLFGIPEHSVILSLEYPRGIELHPLKIQL